MQFRFHIEANLYHLSGFGTVSSNIQLSKKTIKILLPFPTIHLYMKPLYLHTLTKTRYHNRLADWIQKEVWESSCLLSSQTLKRFAKILKNATLHCFVSYFLLKMFILTCNDNCFSIKRWLFFKINLEIIYSV